MLMSSIVDLHLHSNYSDGKFSPKVVITKLAKAGILFASLTDHDSIDGNKEFIKWANKLGVTAIPGVEISAAEQGFGLHILGYGINTNSPSLKNLFVKQARQRQEAFIKTVGLLEKAGFRVDKKKFNKLKNLKAVAKTHVFELIYGDRKNRELFQKNFIFKPSGNLRTDFIQTLMDQPGQIAYVKKDRINCSDAIKLIRQNGGFAVWAHPGLEKIDSKTLPKILKNLISYGLEGLEVFSSAHTKTQVSFFYKLAHKYNLLTTIGTDDHDGLLIGKSDVPKRFQKELLEKLPKFLKKHRRSGDFKK